MQNRALLARRHLEPVAVDLLQLLLVSNALVEIGNQFLIAGKMFQGVDGGRFIFFRSCPRRGSFSKVRRPLLGFLSLWLFIVNAALQNLVLLRPQDPKNRDLYLKMQQAQTALTDVLSRVEQVKAKIATAKPTEKDALQDQKDLLDAEQALDEDEIEDAQQELIQTGADQESAVQRQRDQHEAGEHEFDQHQSQNPVATAPAVDLSANNLAGQAGRSSAAWRNASANARSTSWSAIRAAP